MIRYLWSQVPIAVFHSFYKIGKKGIGQVVRRLLPYLGRRTSKKE